MAIDWDWFSTREDRIGSNGGRRHAPLIIGIPSLILAMACGGLPVVASEFTALEVALLSVQDSANKEVVHAIVDEGYLRSLEVENDVTGDVFDAFRVGFETAVADNQITDAEVGELQRLSVLFQPGGDFSEKQMIRREAVLADWGRQARKIHKRSLRDAPPSSDWYAWTLPGDLNVHAENAGWTAKGCETTAVGMGIVVYRCLYEHQGRLIDIAMTDYGTEELALQSWNRPREGLAHNKDLQWGSRILSLTLFDAELAAGVRDLVVVSEDLHESLEPEGVVRRLAAAGWVATKECFDNGYCSWSLDRAHPYYGTVDMLSKRPSPSDAKPKDSGCKDGWVCVTQGENQIQINARSHAATQLAVNAFVAPLP